MRAALIALVLLLVPVAPAGATGTLAAHGMVYLDSPPSFKEAMFAQAADLGASAIRVDVDVSEIVRPDGTRWWDGLDEDIALARKYHLEVMGVLLGTPAGLARCDASVPDFFRFRCPASSEAAYAGYVGEIVRRSRGAIDDWQVLSEPDNPDMFHGTVADYAARLMASSRAIRAANPAARVVLADLASQNRGVYLARLLDRRGVVGSFDVGALSLRGSVRTVVAAVPKWRRRFDAKGFHGPLWVSEHGYPADPAYQWDPAYVGGEAAQASYLSHSLPGLLGKGAEPRVRVAARLARRAVGVGGTADGERPRSTAAGPDGRPAAGGGGVPEARARGAREHRAADGRCTLSAAAGSRPARRSRSRCARAGERSGRPRR